MKKITKIISNLSVAGLLFAAATNATATIIVDDFESGLTAEFYTFDSGSPVAAFSTTDASPADTVPGASVGNNVLKLEVDANTDPLGFAGIAHDFTSPQDWTSTGSFSFWLFGTGNGNGIFADIREDVDTSLSCCGAEIWKYSFTDDVAGWNLIEIPFSEFIYIVGAEDPGAATQTLDLSQVRGWAFGYEFGLVDDSVYYLDNVTAVSEPTVLVIFGLGLAGLGFARRGRDKA